MKDFELLKNDDLRDIEGGAIPVFQIIEAIALIGGLYYGFREMVKDAGANAAYEELANT